MLDACPAGSVGHHLPLLFLALRPAFQRRLHAIDSVDTIHCAFDGRCIVEVAFDQRHAAARQRLRTLRRRVAN